MFLQNPLLDHVYPLCMWGVTLHEMARRLLFVKRLSCSDIWTTHFKNGVIS
jgi:hypothetical protein